MSDPILIGMNDDLMNYVDKFNFFVTYSGRMEILSDVFGKKYQLYDLIKIVQLPFYISILITIVGSHFSSLKIFLFSFLFSWRLLYLSIRNYDTPDIINYVSIHTCFYVRCLCDNRLFHRFLTSYRREVSLIFYANTIILFLACLRVAIIHNRLFKAQAVNYLKCHYPPTLSFVIHMLTLWRFVALMQFIFRRKHLQTFFALYYNYVIKN